MLQQVHDQLQRMEGQDWQYCWLPAAAVGAVAHLLQAALLRGFGKLPAAMVHLTAAEEAMGQALQQHGYNLEVRATVRGCARVPGTRMIRILRPPRAGG